MALWRKQWGLTSGGQGGLFDHVNQTGMRTQVKGAPTNKKQCKSYVVRRCPALLLKDSSFEMRLL